MDSIEADDLAPPPRPRLVTVGVGLLVSCAIVQCAGWLLWPESVTSNGAQVFFMLLWLWLAYSALTGLGWVRIAIALVLGAFVWGLVNASSVAAGLQAASGGELVAKATAIAALVVLSMPSSSHWFSALAALHSKAESKASDAR